MMKSKKILEIILAIFIVMIICSFNNVQAYTGEIDPENYITLPTEIKVQNGIGTGTITLSSSASGYTISYQKVDITSEQFDAIKAKSSDSSKSEVLSLIPDFTNTWKDTTNTTNNIQFDFSNKTGSVQFVLWVKITNGTNTYYNYNVYSTEINSGAGGSTTDDEWTDFSKAKFELKKNGISGAIIEVTGVTPKDSAYDLIITSDSKKPEIPDITSTERLILTYNSNSKKMTSVDVAKYVELNQDLYVSVIEHRNLKENIVIYGKKLTRYKEPLYSDAFHATYITNDKVQLVTQFTHHESNNRKMQIKIGKVTDQSILQKIKNQNSSGFADLLSYAKTNSGIYDGKVNADRNDSYTIEYNAGSNLSGGDNSGNELINLKNIEDDNYYYLYIKTDDENGKYISNEAVTLAQAYSDGDWGLFFYGSDDFKWTDFGNVTTGGTNTNTNGKDNTVSTTILPQTGLDFVKIGIIVIIAIGSGIAYKKFKEYNF